MAWIRKCAAVVAVTCCVSCGGGGGGGDGNTTPPDGVTVSGLLPTAGTPGEVLYEHAADLRPVLAGAQWDYHRKDYADGLASEKYSTKATAAPAGGVMEVDTDSPDVSTAVTVDAQGSVKFSANLAIVPGAAPLTVSGFELRSPLRVNEQYVLLDRHVVDSGIDVDGDGKADVLNIAIWRTVQGRERVTLPQAGAAIDTVRVDTHLSANITPSAGGTVVVVANRLSSWYAQGLGLVRSATHSTSPSRPFDDESWLTGFSAGSRGWGAMVQPAQYLNDALHPTGIALQTFQTADGALVSTGGYLLRVNKNGHLLSAARLPGLGGSVHMTSGGLRQVVTNDERDIRITALNDDGSENGNVPVVHLNLDDFNAANDFVHLVTLTIAPGGDHYWLVWSKSTMVLGNLTDELRAQAIDLAGRPVGAPVILPSQQSLDTGVVATATADNGLVVTWSEDGSGYNAMAQARIDRDGALVWRSRQTMGLPGPSAVFPLMGEDTVWLTWRASTNGVTDLAYGVRLDAAGQFIGVSTGGGAYNSERLDAMDSAFVEGWPHRFAASADRFHATGRVYGPRYPDVSRSEHHLEYVEFTAGTGRLATGLKQVRRLTLDGVVNAPRVAPMVFDDRVLIFSDNGTTLMPTVVWR